MFRTDETLILPELLELQQFGMGVGLGYVSPERLSQVLDSRELMRALTGAEGALQVFRGKAAVGRFGIAVQGSGAYVKGHIDGKYHGHDFRKAYQVYNLPETTSAKYWFITYSRTHDTSQLKQTVDPSFKQDLNYNLDFTIQGNDRGIQAIWIYYEVIRVKISGTTTDFIVTNPASSGAANPDGSDYPGGFVPIEQT